MMKKIILLTLIFANILNAANVIVNKETFNINEQIVVDFSDMTAQNDDWIGIYPADTTDAWANVIKWNWTNDIVAGNLTFDALPVGSYEVRAFYNNSLNSEASKQFTVENNVNEATTVTTSKPTYTEGETVTVSFSNMSGDEEDWMAVYPVGSTHAWENVVQWDWISGQISGTQEFNNLPLGDIPFLRFFK